MTMETLPNVMCNEVEMIELLAAARVGDIHRLDRLLRPDMDIDSRGRTETEGYPMMRLGPTVLEAAAKCDQLETMRYLIRGGANLNLQWDDGSGPPCDENTILLSTAHCGSGQVLRVLVESGADINRRRFRRSSVLHEAIDGTSTDNLERKMGVADTILDLGFDIETTDEDGRTGLHWAAFDESLQMVELLISKGANVNAMDTSRDTLLDRAASGGRFEVVEFLLQKGAQIDAEEGCNGIALAARDGHTALVALPLDHGAKAENRPRLHTELLSATLSDNDDVVPLLYERGFAYQGPHSLRMAVWLGSLKGAERLLAQGVNINTRDQKGQSTLHCAIIGARLHPRDQTSFLPTRWDLLQFLLDNGADTRFRDENGQTARDLAIVAGYTDAVRMLEA